MDFKRIFKYPLNLYVAYTGLLWIAILICTLCLDVNSWISICVIATLVGSSIFITISAFKALSNYLRDINRLQALVNEIKITEGYDYNSSEISNYKTDAIYDNILMLYNERIKAISDINKKHEEAIEIEKTKLRSKRILTNNINHEIKTPIGILQGYIETMQRHPDIAPELRDKFLGKCFENIRRLDNLMSNISIITRIEDGSEAIKLDRFSLNQILDNAAEEMSITLAKDNINFVIDIPQNTFVNTTESFFHSLITNLIKNAINYAQCTEITFKLIKQDNGFLYFEFRDNGIGVDNEHLEHLFDRFFRIDKNHIKKITGSGLGLPIVKSIVNLHGGTIEASNHKDGGLCFTFGIPQA